MISVENLSFAYAGANEPAVEALEFSIDAGEIFGFLGPSGAGKSTTQKILIGLLRGYRGSVRVLDREVSNWRHDFYERIGVAPELPNHYLKLTGLENLRYFGALYATTLRDPLVLLERLNLADAAAMPVAQYSRGMKTRLGVARALQHNPELLFMDEPTAGLDPVNARLIKELIKAERTAGKTVFLSTHDMATVDELCDRAAFIVDGRIELIDSPRRLKLQHGKPRVRIEYIDGDEPASAEFPLAGLAEDAAFLEVLRNGRVQTIHTQEATLEDVFIRVTGRALR